MEVYDLPGHSIIDSSSCEIKICFSQNEIESEIGLCEYFNQ